MAFQVTLYKSNCKYPNYKVCCFWLLCFIAPLICQLTTFAAEALHQFPATGALQIVLHDDINLPFYAWPRNLLSSPLDRHSACWMPPYVSPRQMPPLRYPPPQNHGAVAAADDSPAGNPPAGNPPAGSSAPGVTPGLNDPAKKEIAMQLVSAAENSSLDWKAQYGYIEYNVERNAKENRGYTGGIIGFTSRTHDMLELVESYDKIAPGNVLEQYLPVLRTVDGSSSRKGLGKAFERAWTAAAKDPKFREAQDHECDRTYFNPAVEQAQRDGLRALGQFIYYDAIVMHGDGDDPTSFGGIRSAAMKKAKTPQQGGDEASYLSAFLEARKAAMLTEEGHSDTSRVDTLQSVFLRENNFDLTPPLNFKTYGDAYTIPAVRPSTR
jgi:chitosanase